MDRTAPAYEIDQYWKITKVNEAFCRQFKCSESSLIGRDIRDLVREARTPKPTRWFAWRAAAPRTVWNFEADQLSNAS